MKRNKAIKTCAEQVGISKLKKEQRACIASVLEGKDVVLIAPTSFGKSITYQIPALMFHDENPKNWTLILEPTISLLRDQVNSLNAKNLSADYLCGVHPLRYEELKGRLVTGELIYLYTTPEQLQQWTLKTLLKENPPKLIVVDEAHCVSQWGVSFRKSYMQIGKVLKNLPSRPVMLACSATILPEERGVVTESLGMHDPLWVEHSLVRSNIFIEINKCKKSDYKGRLKPILRSIEKYGKKGRVVIYCNTKSEVDALWNCLSVTLQESVGKCHAGLSEEQRLEYETEFMTGRLRVMIATTAFGIGIDAPDIRLVLHTRMPFDVSNYYQQIGRAGRDGKKSCAVLLWHENDVGYLKKMMEYQKEDPNLRKQKMMRLEQLSEVLQGNKCLWRGVLTLLGETKVEKHCGHCKNCKEGKSGYEN